MKPLFVTIQLVVVAGICLFSYFIGPPVYWELVARVKDYGFAHFGSLTLSHDGATSKVGSEDQHQGRDEMRNQSTTGESVDGSDRLFTKPVWEKPSSGSRLPPLDRFRLTKEVVESRAIDNVIVVTFANHAFLDFVLNWVKHLTDLKVFNLLVGAMDTEILEALYWQGVPVFDMGSNMKTIDVGWGSRTFHKMGRERVLLVNQILSMGFEVLMCDTDMVWISNPLPYLAKFPLADVLVSSDEVASSVDDDRLEIWERAQGAYNVGIFLWRPSAIAKKFAHEWKTQLLSDDKIWDQNGFNDLMRLKRGPVVSDGSGLFYAFDGTLKLGVLPVSIFCSGHTFFIQALYEQLNVKPYAVHTTFQFAGTPGKRHRLREAKLFYDNQDYYDTPGGFLSFRMVIPEELLSGGDLLSVDDHFKLMNYQIKQIRNALAIAWILNRTLVMPKLWCRLDRLWFGHPGILPGTKTRQPFLCPLDHVFEINNMLDSLDEAVYGPIINFREYSFLDNPRLPKEVKISELQVELCKMGSKGCGAGIKGGLHTMNLPRNSTDREILQALSSHQDFKLVYFSSMEDAFGGFEDKEEARFRARVKRYTGIWCCAQNLQRGHIWYDMYWDEKPNWRPLPPAKPEDDHPPL